MKTIFILVEIVISVQLLFSENAWAVKSKKPAKACEVSLKTSNKDKELNRLLKAGFSESVAFRILKYYPKHLYQSFFTGRNLGMSLVYRAIGGGHYDPIYPMSYFNVAEDPGDGIAETQKWTQHKPFKINGVFYTAFVLELELPTTIYPGDDEDWKISPWKIPNDAIFIRQIGLVDAKTDEFEWIPFDQLHKYGFKFDLKEKRDD